ncbi:hypothetical protein GPJ56_002632 [Histomonas meleagridis]|uniref:uncharacterized protein n=1 Tax=Histomonas meleagridis TaxID=135588 RepID=UPI00355ABCAE|nr:hypothetical protein GPJ56_002632 [Histomonas meleagridis]KAH0801431.1 hypothetical protein GO595_006026 [Histomonas meleagridis]
MSNRFDSLLNQVQTRLEVLENTASEFGSMKLDQKRQAVSRSRREIQTIRNNLAEMARLIQTMPQRDKEFFQTDLTSCQDSFQQIQVRYDALNDALQKEIESAKQAGEEGGIDEDLARSNHQKGMEILATLNNTIATNKDTLNTQEHTKNTLAEDRKLLEHTSDNLYQIDNEADKGLAAAGRMIKRGLMNKGITWGICVVLAIILAVILYLKMK